MKNKLFVGGLAWATDDNGLRSFESWRSRSQSDSDRDTGRSRGFGFVTFSSDEAAESAMGEMDGKELDGRTIRVNIAQERSRGGGGGRGGRGGGGGGGRW